MKTDEKNEPILGILNGAQLIKEFNKTIEKLEDSGGKSALHIAFENGYLGLAKILIHGGLDVNAIISETGVTLLHMAVDAILKNEKEIELYEFISFLLQNKADPNIKRIDTINHPTVLHTVISSDPLNKKLVEMLLANGASPFISNVLGRSAIDISFTRKNRDLFIQLLNNTK